MLCFSLGACGRDTLVDSFGCPEHQLVCDGACTDVSSDDANCGSCGTVCGSGEECLVGRCRPACEGPELLCAEGCVDIASDEENCGRCNNRCAPGARCTDGECSATGCPPGLQQCGDACVDTTTDPEHCGECFAECDAGMRCDNNLCVDECGERTDCAGRCVDLEVDRNHCGACDNRCGAGETCADGRCSSCPDDLVLCGNSCVDLLTHPNHCGSCNTACALDAKCELGVCSSCEGPTAAVCDGLCVDLSTNPDHCGGCNLACDGSCASGACCPSPAVACGDECADLESSVEHCGACFSSCSPGQFCLFGTCDTECPMGLVLCGDTCRDVSVDPEHCGACGTPCSPDSVCVSGSCEVMCTSPEISCDGACVDPGNDPDHCGGCDVSCEQDLVCRGGSCVDPGDVCDFSALEFPVSLNGGISVSDVTVDEDCNLYVGMQDEDFNGVVYRVEAATGEAAIIATFPGRVRGLVYRPQDGLLYGTSLDRLVTVAPDGSDPQTLDESVTGEFLNGMTIAPSNWSAGESYLVVAQSTGDIVIYDPESPAPEVFAHAGVPLSDVEFAGQQLYAAAYDSSEILKVTPSGVLSTFVTLPCSPDGLTVEAGGRLFVACGNTGDIYELDVETAEYSWMSSVSLSSGWAPSGLLFQPGLVFVVAERTGLNALFL